MFNLETVRCELRDYYQKNMVSEKIINIEGRNALLLVETQSSFELVKLTDFTGETIGAIDLLVIHRIQKSGDQLHDMSEMILLILEQFRNKIYRQNEKITQLTTEINLETQRMKDELF